MIKFDWLLKLIYLKLKYFFDTLKHIINKNTTKSHRLC